MANSTISVTHNTLKQHRKTSLLAGFFYILTFISIPTLFLYIPIHDPNYMLIKSTDTGIVIGGILEIIVALSGIVTAVVLYPLLRIQNATLAIGLIAARIVEAGTIFTGVAFLLGAVTLHQQNIGESAVPVGRALVALYDRIFILGQGFMPGIDDLLLGILLYKSRLVPRGLSVIGIVGAFPLFAGYFAIMFGVIDRSSPFTGLAAVMVAVFEFSLGIYMLVQGLKKSPATTA